MQIQKRPSIGELIEHTETGDTAAIEVWLEPLFPREQRAIKTVLDAYMGFSGSDNKVATHHALARYIANAKPLSTEGRVEGYIFETAKDYLRRLDRIKNAIASPDKVVARNDRSEDLGAESSVLHSASATVAPYGYEGVRNTIMRMHGKGKSMPVHPLLNAAMSADEINAGSSARWAIRQNPVEARFEKWCTDLEGQQSHPSQLGDMAKKRHVMRIFNSYIDVITETETKFLQNNESVQSMISANKGIIIKELASQLDKRLREHSSCDDLALKVKLEQRLEKYYAAIGELFGDLDLHDSSTKDLAEALAALGRVDKTT